MSPGPGSRLFRLAVEAAEFGVVVADAGQQHWPTVYVNPAFERITGYTTDEVLGRDCSFLQGADQKQPQVFRLRRALRAGKAVTVTLRNYRKTGELFWNRLSVRPSFDEDGKLTHFVGMQHDVTRRVEAESRMLDVLERVGDGFYAVDRDWRFTFVNRRAEELLECKGEDLLGRSLWMEFPEAINTAFEEHYRHAMTEMSPTNFVEYFPPLKKWYEARAFPNRSGLAVYFRDITEKRQNETRLQYLVSHDALTGLPNRERCMTILREAASAATRAERELEVLYFDLDGFKEINDSIGHAAGDEVLRQVTRRILACRPSKSELARFSSDEFVMVVDSRDGESLLRLAGEIIEAIREPIQVLDRQLRVSASVGLSIFPEAGADADALIVNADLAMLAAKQAGRGCSRLFDSSIVHVQRRRMQLLYEMRLPRIQKQTAVHYQPKLCAVTGELSGFEALSRWTHPQLGPISPNEFIPLAEESGEISRIGAWVLDTVSRQLRTWIDEGLEVVPVSVNVSVGQIESPDFLQTIDAALAAHRVPPSLLQVEITESLLMRSFEVGGRVIAGLAERGIEVHLDDFGTGYSSLSCLWQLPVVTVKLDRSFTVGLTEGLGSEALVRSAIGLAHALSKTVVAEGVETVEQEALLREMGCDQLQGFKFSRPMPVEGATAFLRQARLTEPTRVRPPG